MPNYCPGPATFVGLQERMSQMGVGLLVALALFGVTVRLARPQGWRLRR